jgi:hypothetical protein
MSVIKKVKDFLGGLDSGYDEKADEKAAASRWTDFLMEIAAEIERVMRAELLEPPGEPAYIPPEYLVFLSPDDDAALRGDRRVGFVRGLCNITAKRAAEVIKGRAQTDKVFVELRMDGSLGKGEFYVKAIWEADQQKTGVLGTRRPAGAPTTGDVGTKVLNEETRVLSLPQMTIEVTKKDSSEQTVRRFQKPEITIGRGGQAIQVDLELVGDLEISRLHAVVQRISATEFKVSARGKNPMVVQDKELQAGEEAVVSPNDEIQIGSYVLRVVKNE